MAVYRPTCRDPKAVAILTCCAGLLIGQGSDNDPGGWGRAKWGITQNQLLGLYPGQIKLLPRLLVQDRLWASLPAFEIGGKRFLVSFDFGKIDRLERVFLERSPATTDTKTAVDDAIDTNRLLLQILEGKYGEPKDRPQLRFESSTFREKVWLLPQTKITLLLRVDPLVAGKNLCILTYEARQTAESDKL